MEHNVKCHQNKNAVLFLKQSRIKVVPAKTKPIDLSYFYQNLEFLFFFFFLYMKWNCQEGIHQSGFFVHVNWEDLFSSDKFKPSSQADKHDDTSNHAWNWFGVQNSNMKFRPDDFRFRFGKRAGKLMAQEFPEFFFLVGKSLPSISRLLHFLRPCNIFSFSSAKQIILRRR